MSGRVDSPANVETLCECPCHTNDIGLCEQCCESMTAWNAAIDAVIESHKDLYDWDRALMLSLKKKS